jgi:hypothetical protein
MQQDHRLDQVYIHVENLHPMILNLMVLLQLLYTLISPKENCFYEIFFDY